MRTTFSTKKVRFTDNGFTAFNGTEMMEEMSMRKLSAIVLASIFPVLIFSANLSAVQRGIKVTAKSGNSVYLYKDYHALVVGVGDYDHWPDLKGAVRDAIEVAAQVKKSGIKTTLLLNPTSRELKRALSKLVYGPGKEKDRAILFYFSGHGETETLATGEKMGYLVPKDAPMPGKDRMDFTDKAISMSAIESYALRIKSKHVLMMFDSCFSGSVFSSLKGVPTDISEKSNRPVRQFITAGNENEQVPDDSIFRICFLQGIKGEADLNKDGYVTGSELGFYLDSSVVNYTRGSQHPQYGKIRRPELDKGDFVFTLTAQPESEAPALRQSNKLNNYDKIIHDREANRKKWDEWQERFEQDIAKVERYDQNPTLNEKEKAAAWEDLRTSYNIDNPHTLKDNEYRKRAKERILYWKGKKEWGKLYVDTTPPDAIIKILNIRPKFRQGIQLKPGRYHIATSREGYETKRIWVDLNAAEIKRLDIRLEHLTASVQTVSNKDKLERSEPEKIRRDFDLEQSPNKGEVSRGWLGVAIQDLTKELRKYYGVKGDAGVLVTEVFPGDPAEVAGIRAKDIILSVNGKEVDGSRQLSRTISEYPVGKEAKILLLRNGNEKEFYVKLAKRPQTMTAANEPEVQRKNPFGIEVSNLTPEIIQKFQLRAEKGVMVASVEPGSKGEVAGVIPGDLIKEINHEKVTDVDQYMKEIVKYKKGDTLWAYLLRKERGYLAIKLIK